jgi:hypothetical protein
VRYDGIARGIKGIRQKKGANWMLDKKPDYWREEQSVLSLQGSRCFIDGHRMDPRVVTW